MYSKRLQVQIKIQSLFSMYVYLLYTMSVRTGLLSFFTMLLGVGVHGGDDHSGVVENVVGWPDPKRAVVQNVAEKLKIQNSSF